MTKLVNEVLVVEPTRGVTVNDQMFPCIRGTPTESGFYKNGWTTKQIEGKNGKHTYLQWNVYTSAGSQIDIEMKAMFRLKNAKWNLCLHTGWHGVNLYDGDNDYIINYLQSCRRPVNDNDSDVDSDDSSEQGGGGTAAEPASPTTTTATAGSEFEFEMRGDERLDEYVRTTYGSTKDWELSDDRTHPNYVNGKVIDDDGKFLIGIIIVEREDNDDEDKRKFDFVKGWVRESIGSDAAVSGWEFDGETLTINHEDDDEVEQYTLDEIGYNEEDNSDGGAAATSAQDDSESTLAPEGDGGDDEPTTSSTMCRGTCCITCEKCYLKVPAEYLNGTCSDEMWVQCSCDAHPGWYCPNHSPGNECRDDEDCDCCNPTHGGAAASAGQDSESTLASEGGDSGDSSSASEGEDGGSDEEQYQQPCGECGCTLDIDTPIMCYCDQDGEDTTLCSECYWDIDGYWRTDTNVDNAEERAERFATEGGGVSDGMSRSQFRAWAKSPLNKSAAAGLGHVINGNSSNAAIRAAMDAVQEQAD